MLNCRHVQSLLRHLSCPILATPSQIRNEIGVVTGTENGDHDSIRTKYLGRLFTFTPRQHVPSAGCYEGTVDSALCTPTVRSC